MTTLAIAELCEPGLILDKRQRAMLKEMGVQVWQPLPVAHESPVAPVAITAKTMTVPAMAAHKPAPVNPSVATNSGAAHAYIQVEKGTLNTLKQTLSAVKTTPSAETSTTPSPTSASSTVTWRMGILQTLYTLPPEAKPSATRWLILIESMASALQASYNPFEGDAGTLLDNMLRAAKRHTAGVTQLLPLVRGSEASSNDLSRMLAETFASTQADVVLVMGRFAAQALLQSTEPLAKLRGHAHSAHDTKTIITIDPAALLRNPLDKAKAWDDLCLAMSVTSVADPESTR